MASHRSPSRTREPPDVTRPHPSTLVAFHEAAASLHAEVDRRALKRQPLSDVSAEVEQLIWHIRAVADQWQDCSHSSPALTRAADDCEAILASLEGLRSRYSA